MKTLIMFAFWILATVMFIISCYTEDRLMSACGIIISIVILNRAELQYIENKLDEIMKSLSDKKPE